MTQLSTLEAAGGAPRGHKVDVTRGGRDWPRVIGTARRLGLAAGAVAYAWSGNHSGSPTSNPPHQSRLAAENRRQSAAKRPWPNSSLRPKMSRSRPIGTPSWPSDEGAIRHPRARRQRWAFFVSELAHVHASF